MTIQHARCFWVDDSQIYRDYHDREWGFPVYNDTRLFEKICLEGFQSGLSWITILKKRENFRAAFAGFDVAQVARFTEKDVECLLGDAGIVRHRGKIEAAINNARCAEKLLESERSLAAYFWKFEPPASSRPKRITRDTLRAMTQNAESVALSKDLKKRGWKFVGPTTMYAFMQAMGLVNDHEESCFVREAALKARKQFDPNKL
ncbi:DNA-3-methyladenine glycosylase I [Rhodoferax sp. GW822-FHT02A01]|uniref:DNA-3-methyladenine glycosylase I n=1 Tax=Rhodoferax sp. GW822-FHT02A01 TaxID=3141537 RepID=UPI00315C6208